MLKGEIEMDGLGGKRNIWGQGRFEILRDGRTSVEVVESAESLLKETIKKVKRVIYTNKFKSYDSNV